MRLVRRLRAGLPDRDADREVASSTRASPNTRSSPPAPIAASAARSRPRCRAKKSSAWCPTRTAAPTKATPASRAASPSAMRRTRIASSTPMIREKITDPWRVVSWDEAIKFAADRFKADASQVWPGLHRRHHLLAHDQRGSLRRAAHGPRRLRQQQRRYLRPRLPLADRLRLEADVRRIGRHAGLQERRQVRRHHGHRRQPDRRPSRVRLAHEEAPARRRQADRHRPAPHRHRARARTSRPTITCSSSPRPTSPS